MSERRPSNRLRQLREERGLTRQDVARILDISERTVIRHEDGTTPLRQVHKLAYADLYAVPVGDLEVGAAA